MADGRLICPHCQGVVAANPLGHWFQRFQCPHCKKGLQFDARTNYLGIAAAACFVAMMFSALMGEAPWTPWFPIAAGVLCAVSIALSYGMRAITKA
jgi:uncharacterized paraquat-inducible protein A